MMRLKIVLALKLKRRTIRGLFQFFSNTQLSSCKANHVFSNARAALKVFAGGLYKKTTHVMSFVVRLCDSISSYIECLQFRVAELKSHILEHSYCQCRRVLRSNMSATAELRGLQLRTASVMSCFFFFFSFHSVVDVIVRLLHLLVKTERMREPAWPTSMLVM